MPGRLARHAAIAATITIVVCMAACASPRDPIIINDGMLVLENQSRREWRNVVITVNDHFRGGTRSLAAGGRLNAPLRDFQTGFGQKYDRGRMSVFKVDVTATDSEGTPVKLHWGK
ncbi:MAG: hypothetical protein LC804_03575 [Acidobacteria bacterium]|nr:hypothetical protein [Acidobacteriota bacterium]